MTGPKAETNDAGAPGRASGGTPGTPRSAPRFAERPPLRLLQVMLSTQEGGAETFFEKLAFAFDARGVAQRLVVEPFPAREARLRELKHAKVAPRRFGGSGRWAAPRWLRRQIADFRPTAVLTWMNRASRRLPAHLPCPAVGRIGGYYPLKHYRRCDHLVGITPDLVRHLTDGGWPADRATLIPNFGETPEPVVDPIAVRAALRGELGVPERAKLLVSLGRLHEVKAHDTSLRALAELPGVHLMIAGTGPLEAELRGLAGELGVADRTHFLGWRRDAQNLFAAADACLFPSRYEPNGTVVMEAWAHGVPLVAAAAKGPAWLVEPGENGLLFPIDDVAALVGQLRSVLNDPARAASLVAGGRDTFDQGFTRDRVVDAYLGLFERLRAAGG